MSGHFVWDVLIASAAWLVFFVLYNRLSGFYIVFIACCATWRTLGLGIHADIRLFGLLGLLFYPVLWLAGFGVVFQFVVGLFGGQIDFWRAVPARRTFPSPEPDEGYQAVQIGPLEQRGIPKTGIYDPIMDHLNEWQRDK